MKTLFSFLITICCYSLVHSQPVSNDPSVTLTLIHNAANNAVRIAKCRHDSLLYYCTFNGNIYRIYESSPGVYADSLVAAVNDHQINFLQGMVFDDSILYISGNHKNSGSAGYGIVAKGVMQNGVFSWTNIFTTEPYPSAATLYDHAFSSICLSPSKDSLYISSGSRTDHGEIQTVNGLFPDQREAPLTSKIFKVPVTLSNFLMLNDSAWLDSSGFVFAQGVRNNFDMAFNNQGDLIGVENSGDRDDPEEINWLREGHHYGFPWKIGGNYTGQQYSGYIPANDLLINHNSLGWTNNYFKNDSTYPEPPFGVTFTEPVKNQGPYADKFRDASTGIIYDASDSGIYITSLTPHRSPLGLVFDNGKMDGIYNNSGFFLCYTIGSNDSSGYIPGTGIGPFLEPGQELLRLSLAKDSTGNYNANVYPVITGFTTPVDADIDDNIIYVLENRGNNPSSPAGIYKVIFPPFVSSVSQGTINKHISFFPNPTTGEIYSTDNSNRIYQVYNAAGIFIMNVIFTNGKADLQDLNGGLYILSDGAGMFYKIIRL